MSSEQVNDERRDEMGRFSSGERTAQDTIDAIRLALEKFFDPEAGWQVTGCERVRSIDEHVAEESYLG